MPLTVKRGAGGRRAWISINTPVWSSLRAKPLQLLNNHKVVTVDGTTPVDSVEQLLSKDFIRGVARQAQGEHACGALGEVAVGRPVLTLDLGTYRQTTGKI